MIGANWKKMTDPERAKYVQMAKDDKEARANISTAPATSKT